MFIANVLAIASQSLVKRKESVSDSESAAVMEEPHQPRSGSFPSRAFGKTKIVNRLFQSVCNFKCVYVIVSVDNINITRKLISVHTYAYSDKKIHIIML